MRKKVEQLEDLHSVHHVSSCMLSVAWKDPRVHLMPSFHYLQILNCLLIQRSTFFSFAFSSAQFSHSVMSDSLRPHESQHVRPPCPSPTPRVHSNSSIESVTPSSHLFVCCPLLLLLPIPPNIRVFSNESTLHMRWPKCWSFSFSISPSKEHPGLISFRMDCLDLLAV